MHSFFIDKENENIFLKVSNGSNHPNVLQELVANTSDGAMEKHVPLASKVGNTVKVSVGEIMHPMEEKHYITMVCLHTNQGVYVKTLQPKDKPEVEFALLENETPHCVYEYCNLHGLWKVDVK